MPRRKLISTLQKVQNAQDVSDVVGRWKVAKAVCHEAGTTNKEIVLQLDGVEVTLDEQMDVMWQVPAEVEQLQLPMFQATSYMLEEDRITFLAGSDGNSFPFEIRERDGSRLLLQSDTVEQQVITISITRITEGVKTSVVFTLVNALEEGYFSDLKVRSSEGTERMVHKAVMSASCPGMAYRDWEIFLGSLSTGAFEAVLSYIYDSCLPRSLTLEIAEEVLSGTALNPKLASLHELSKAFIESQSLKLYIIQVVEGLQSSVETAYKMVEPLDVSDLAKVHYTIKQLVREAAVVATKFVLLCELYSRNKKAMSKPERKEILQYVKDRLAPMVDSVERLLSVVLQKWGSLSDDQKTETVQYFIPELEHIWDLFNENITPIEDVLSSKFSTVNTPQKDKKLSTIIQFINRAHEIRKLRVILKNLKDIVKQSKERREAFRELSNEERVARISNIVAELSDEGERALNKLGELKTKTGSTLEWWKYKLSVDIIRSQVAWGVSKVVTLKTALKPTLMRLCKFVKRQDLNESLVLLNVLETSDLSGIETEEESHQMSQLPSHTSSGALASENSALAMGCSKLLGSQQYTDLCFVLPPGSPGAEPVVIQAHRVIVAARCEWFKRALQSGMKEAIDKRIEVSDTEEDTFRKFLNFLYGGNIALEALEVDEVTELLVVADRYEVETLRSLCETELLNRLGSTNVFTLLVMADQYSVTSLREACFHYIVCNPNVIFTEVEGYATISEELKETLREHLMANDPSMLLQYSTVPVEQTPPPTPPLVDMHPVTPMLEWGQVDEGEGEEEGEEEGEGEEEDGISAALLQMKDIVGTDATDDVLKSLLLAADMDINRAVNFYFSSMS